MEGILSPAAVAAYPAVAATVDAVVADTVLCRALKVWLLAPDRAAEGCII